MPGVRELLSLKRLFVVYCLSLILAISLLSVFDVFQRPDPFFLGPGI